jgi:hypothetical protein
VPVPVPVPVVQQPQRIDPYAASNPYGLPAVQERPYVPMQRSAVAAVQYAPVRQGTSGASVGYVIVGGVAFVLSLISLAPASPVFYYSAGGIIAIVGGIRTLLRRNSYATGVGAPIAGIILGSLAVICMIAGIAIHSTSHVTYSNQTVGTSNAGGTNGDSGSSSGTLPAAPSFAADTALSGYETTAYNVAHSVDEFANGGLTYAPNPSWPATLTLSGNAIMFPSGTSFGDLPADQLMDYELSDDKSSFDVFISGGDKTQIAVYDSSSNSFSWICETGAPSYCPPGGVNPGSDPGGTTTSNS